METNQCKRINVSENFFSYGKEGKVSNKKEKSRKRSINSISDIKTKNVKELLLQKLKQYKKERTRKNKSVAETPIDNNFKDKSSFDSPPIANDNVILPLQISQVKQTTSLPIIPSHYDSTPKYDLNKEPLYGNLKNGNKPTMRQLVKTSKQFVNNKSKQDKGKIKVEIEKKYLLGRNKSMKKVGVFIKNNTLRRTIDEEKKKLRNVKIKTVKNYLKGKNLIKYGSYAPNELLREIFDTSKLCGDIENINGNNLVHNFMNDS